MMGEELKPCPFCGHDASAFGVCGVVKVLCSNCSASTGPRLSLQGAIEDWNRRAIDVDALREVVDELECALRPKDYTSMDALCELSNDASKALAKRIRKAVGL
jgi:Lar family restriction alleviation protein|nr:MAG TPA: restriction alleviation protein [Caudoviricetes sp.]